MKQKWCVSLGADGWSYFLHPYCDEGDDNISNTDIYPTFREAKRECLAALHNHLHEVKQAIKETKNKRAKSGGWALKK